MKDDSIYWKRMNEKWCSMDSNKKLFGKEHFYNIVYALTRRPRMYVTEEKLEYIYYFLFGMQISIRTQNTNVSDKIESCFCEWFHEWLLKWIHANVDENYKYETECWYVHIKNIAESEEEECKLFYKLVKLFIEDYETERKYF